MLYFDWYNHAHFGSIRQQIWAILHFPLHLTLVLQVEGASQFIVWRKVAEVVLKISNSFAAAGERIAADPNASLETLQTSINDTVYNVFAAYPPTYMETYTNADADILSIGNASISANDTLTLIDHLYLTVQNSVFETYGIKTPKAAYSVTNSFDTFNANMNVFSLVVSLFLLPFPHLSKQASVLTVTQFVYFFVASGATLILMNLLNFLSKPKRSYPENIRIIVNFLLGAALCGVGGAVNTEFAHKFATSSWVLPMVAFVLGFVLLVNHLHLFWWRNE